MDLVSHSIRVQKEARKPLCNFCLTCWLSPEVWLPRKLSIVLFSSFIQRKLPRSAIHGHLSHDRCWQYHPLYTSCAPRLHRVRPHRAIIPGLSYSQLCKDTLSSNLSWTRSQGGLDLVESRLGNLHWGVPNFDMVFRKIPLDCHRNLLAAAENQIHDWRADNASF